jgi:hypothetical protein
MNALAIKSKIFFIAAVILLPISAFSDDNHDKNSKYLPVVTNETYKNACGSCHFAYQPSLLPSRSWEKIIDDENAHPGGVLSLDEKEKTEIKKYLTQNSAEKIQAKRSNKIMNSVGNSTPVMISEIPYIKHKHHKISQEVFARKAIGSRGNCIACHKNAGSGFYEDDDVVIPN